MGVAAAVITAVTAVASTALGVYSSAQQANIQNQQAEAQKNAQIEAQQRAQYEAQVRTQQEQRQLQIQQAQAEYNARLSQKNSDVFENNARMAEFEGREAKRISYEESLKKRQEAAQLVGQQRAAQSASGAVVDVGSALDLTLDTVEKGELDAFAIRKQGLWQDYNSRVDAWNFRQQGAGHSTESALYSNQAKNYANTKPNTTFISSRVPSASYTDPFMAAAPSLLNGLSLAGSTLYMMTK